MHSIGTSLSKRPRALLKLHPLVKWNAFSHMVATRLAQQVAKQSRASMM